MTRIDAAADAGAGPPERSARRVVVGVPTYRRPAGLARLLAALGKIAHPLAIVVADNDAGSEGAAAGIGLVRALQRDGYPHPIEAVAVPERGIAQVRNAIIRHALARPGTDFIAMVDDDEWPEPGWIEALLAVQGACDAQVVGGPVRRTFEVPVAAYIARANNWNVGARRSGRVDFVDATSNVLFDADLFRRVPEPWFDPAFALTGGEDKDLMTRLRMNGARFAWADEAPVAEELPASRCRRAWAIQRAFSVGNSDMLINLKRRPPGFNALSESVKIAAALAFALVNVAMFWNGGRVFEGQRLAARVGGKLAALLGHRHLEYETIHGR